MVKCGNEISALLTTRPRGLPSVILPYCIKAKKMYEHNVLGYWSGLALCLTMVRSSRARCPATALILYQSSYRLSKVA